MDKMTDYADVIDMSWNLTPKRKLKINIALEA